MVCFRFRSYCRHFFYGQIHNFEDVSRPLATFSLYDMLLMVCSWTVRTKSKFKKQTCVDAPATFIRLMLNVILGRPFGEQFCRDVLNSFADNQLQTSTIVQIPSGSQGLFDMLIDYVISVRLQFVRMYQTVWSNPWIRRCRSPSPNSTNLSNT